MSGSTLYICSKGNSSISAGFIKPNSSTLHANSGDCWGLETFIIKNDIIYILIIDCVSLT